MTFSVSSPESGEHLAVDLDLRARGEDLLEGALGHHARVALVVAHDDRKAPALEVERQLVDAVVALGELLGGDGGAVGRGPDLVGPLGERALDDRRVDEVLDAGREIAVEESVAQDAGVLVAVDVQVALEDDAVLGEGAGLVGAQDVDRAEVLDGVEALDDHTVAAEVDRALAEARGHEHGQHLGREADRDGQREEQGRYPIALGDAGDDEDERQHDEHQAHEQAARGLDAGVEGGLALAADERAGGLAEHRAGAGGHDDAAGVARDHGGAHEGEVLEVGERSADDGAVLGELRALLDRLGLAGERSLAHKEVAGGEDAEVGGDDVAGREVDDVADDDLVDRGLVAAVAVALDLGGGLDHLGQGLGRHGALLVLDKAQDAGDEHHRADDQRRREVALASRGKDPVREDRDHGDEDEDVGEGVGERRQEAQGQGFLGRLGDGIGAVELAGAFDLVGGKTLLAAAELHEKLVARDGGYVAQPFLLARGAGCLLGGPGGLDVACAHAGDEVAQLHGAPRNPGIYVKTPAQCRRS